MGGLQSLASLSQQQIYTELNTHKYATNYTDALKTIYHTMTILDFCYRSVTVG